MTYKVSNAQIIKRVPKTDSTPYAFIPADTVAADSLVMVAFGGDLTYTERSANFYAKQLEEVLKENGINNIDIYSIVYDFGSIEPMFERSELFRIAGRRLIKSQTSPIRQQRIDAIIQEMRDNEAVPNYVKKIHDIFLRPRFSDETGKKINLNQAISRIRKIKFYAHCHGAVTIYEIANYMYDEMLKIGYTKKEIETIQKELLIIQHNPVAPLDKQKFTTISFTSATDKMMLKHNNIFADWVFNNAPEDLLPCYFDTKYGNIFVAKRLYENVFTEHDNKCLTASEKSNCSLTKDGQIIFNAERNAIAGGAKKSLEDATIKSVEELVEGNGVNFKQLKENGDKVYNLMLTDLHQQSLKRGHQK